MVYNLKLYDEIVLTFDYSNTIYEGEKCNIIYLNEDKKHLLPIGLELSSIGILSWLKTRILPKNRYNSDLILSRMGLSINDTMGIINVCMGLSLNDSYFIVKEKFNGKFKDYNLYENNFSNSLALIAYTGYGSVVYKGFTSSPEFTTNGILKKCWRRINGEIYLYKGGTSGASNTGLEPYSEFYASQVAETMGINHIDYDLKVWKKTLSSVCKLFTSIDISYVPFWKLIKDYSLKSITQKLNELGHKFYDSYVDMIVFDAVIFNTDRHLGNFGVLVNSHTNEIVDFAPVFDNGLSLFNYAVDDEFDDLDKYSKTRHPAIGISYEEVVKALITNRQKECLKKLINFKFKLHSRYNLNKNRLHKLEKFIQKRAISLLEL